MSVEAIYTLMGQTLDDSIDEPYLAAFMDVVRVGRSVRISGSYLSAHDELKPVADLAPGPELFGAVNELHAITTEEGTNRWNGLRFTLRPDGSFNLDFVWDQARQDEYDFYANGGTVEEWNERPGNS